MLPHREPARRCGRCRKYYKGISKDEHLLNCTADQDRVTCDRCEVSVRRAYLPEHQRHNRCPSDAKDLADRRMLEAIELRMRQEKIDGALQEQQRAAAEHAKQVEHAERFEHDKNVEQFEQFENDEQSAESDSDLCSNHDFGAKKKQIYPAILARATRQNAELAQDSLSRESETTDSEDSPRVAVSWHALCASTTAPTKKRSVTLGVESRKRNKHRENDDDLH